MVHSFFLSPTWLTEAQMDQELTVYRLKAFIQKVKEAYRKLYLQPSWEESNFHANQLKMFRQSWETARNAFPRIMEKPDWQNLKWIYQTSTPKEDWENWLDELTLFASEEFKSLNLIGKEIFTQILEDLTIEIIGIEPLYLTEGYLIITCEEKNEARIFRYHFGPIHWQANQSNNFQVNFLFPKKPASSLSLFALKTELIHRFPDLPNPAVWNVSSKFSWPVETTLLPVALYELKSRVDKRAIMP
jgi:succinate dehydrogenase flavin-adding protein (antitoxin of CptAB toxin-antitoxin module)